MQGPAAGFEHRYRRPIPADAGLLLLRLFTGLSLALAHGIGKLPPSDDFVAGVAEMGFPVAPAFGWAAALAESMGGMLLALGLFTRPAALAVAATMSVAALVRQAGDPFLDRELAFLYLFTAIHFLLTGPGRISVDHYLNRERATRAVPGRIRDAMATLSHRR